MPVLYPQILSVQRRDPDQRWSDAMLTQAETLSRQTRRAALGGLDLTQGRYQLVLAATPTSYALTIDMRAMVPWPEWPMKAESSPVRVTLEHAGQRYVVQAGAPAADAPAHGWHFGFHKLLAAESQPFDVVATRTVGWSELPWAGMLAWPLGVAALLAALHHLQRQRSARRRAEELLRLGQVARLNTLGELAAGMAHELNQPLTAVLANTQAAQRLLLEAPPNSPPRATPCCKPSPRRGGRPRWWGACARRWSGRTAAGQHQPVAAVEAVRRALYLLEPECQRREVVPGLDAPQAVTVLADPVALDQIVHNLILNALQALEQVPPAQRRLTLTVSTQGARADISVADSGPGIAPEVLSRLFEPFFSTREGGLGLGLSLCETLAQGMGGALSAANAPQGGAVFRLQLPLATGTP